MVSLPQVHPPKPYLHLSSLQYVPHAPPISFLLDHPNMWCGVQVMKRLIMQFPSPLCHLIPLRPKYLPQHSITKHPWPIVRLQFERPSLKPIQNNSQNYSSVYFNPLNAKLNPFCYLLALLGAHHFLHVSRIRVKLLTFRLLMSYIYGAPILDVSRSHTTQHSR